MKGRGSEGSRTTMRLPFSFYNRPALDVARDVLGAHLVFEEAGKRRAGIIVETEAYIGEHDLACHAAKGRTARTEVLFGAPGRAYVYLIYGMYDCFNIVTEPEGIAAAVLVRGLEPLLGLDTDLQTDGPGKLCRAMGITRLQNRWDLTSSTLFIEPGEQVASRRVSRGPRVGVDYSGKWAEKRYRFWIKNNPHVSRAGR